MQRQYGLRLFKCNRLGCPYFRTGFEALSERDRHLRTHDRPYKCDRPNCDFSHMGFGSQARLNVHLQRHEKQGRSSMAHTADTDNEQDVELVVLDAVKADDLDLVRDFIEDVRRFPEECLRQAVLTSSCEMLELLLEACKSEQNIESTILAHAVKADNLAATRMLLDRGAFVTSTVECMSLAMMNRSPEMIRLLLPNKPVQGSTGIPKIYTLCDMIRHSVLPGDEARVIQCLSLLRDRGGKGAFEACFMENATLPQSIAIAEFCLRNGVEIGYSHWKGTALYEAS